VTSGPYNVIARFTTQDYVLGKNPHYWQKGKYAPKISCLEYVQAASNDAALALIERVASRRARALPLAVADRDALLDVVHLLDGLPLALELAAARLALLTPSQLHERLRSSLDLLREDRSDRPRRQRSLGATVEWTLGLLDPPARELFVRLAVFAGPVELDMLEAVVSGEGVEVLDALAALLDVALLRRVETGDGHVRFGLPEALRQMPAGHALLLYGRIAPAEVRLRMWFADRRLRRLAA